MSVEFNGPVSYEVRSVLSVCRSAMAVAISRILKGPTLPAWNWGMEFATRIFRKHLQTAFNMSAQDGRRYLDSVIINDSSLLSRVYISKTSASEPHGQWFVPNEGVHSVKMLYLHGGGFSFYPRTYANLIAAITISANAATLALDYGMSPEHRFPAALQETTDAYRWLLERFEPGEIVVVGDSAGGNLTFSLLLSVREAGLPMPALAIALSPATNFVVPEDLLPTASFLKNTPYDWIQPTMLIKWADWYCDSAQRHNPSVSPIYADLRGLCPMYIQAGTAEILYDSIKDFADSAQAQGADVTFEGWDCMNHDFQLFGNMVPQSVDAIKRIGDLINSRLRISGARENASRST